MKRIFALTIFICAFTFLSGCSPDQYAIEKRYWQAQKQAQQIFKNPHASPPRELEITVNALNKFAKEYATNNLSIDAEFTIARIYIVKEEYDKARAHLKMLLDKYSKSANLCSEILFLTGNSYEIENKWNLALQEYKKIMQEYPTTLRGIDIPIYIAQHYKIKYQPDKMLTAFQEAIVHYKTLVNKYPNSALSFNLDSLIAQCYVEMKDWQNAVSSFDNIIEAYKGKANLDTTLMQLAIIYNKELNNKLKAKETLERLVKDYPKSRLTKTAMALLEEWDKK